MAVLRESPWYSEIAQEGYEEGMQRGMQQGMQQGLEQGLVQGLETGLEKGRRDVAIQPLSDVLRHRFGPLSDALRNALIALPTDQLLALFDIALEAESLQTFQTHVSINDAMASPSAL